MGTAEKVRYHHEDSVTCDSILALYTIPRFTALQALRRDDIYSGHGSGRHWNDPRMAGPEKSGPGFEYVEAFPGETKSNRLTQGPRRTCHTPAQ